jgi:predicted phage-related endonuclease
MKDHEYEVEEDANPVVEHFKQSISEIELAKKLSRYYELKTEIEILEQRKEEIGKELKEAGRGAESLMAGDYAAFFQKVSGRVTTDWKQAYRDAVGEMPSEDVSKYVKKGEDTIRMEVKRIR